MIDALKIAEDAARQLHDYQPDRRWRAVANGIRDIQQKLYDLEMSSQAKAQRIIIP